MEIKWLTKKAHKGAVQHDKVSGSCPDQQVMYGSCPNSIKMQEQSKNAQENHSSVSLRPGLGEDLLFSFIREP